MGNRRKKYLIAIGIIIIISAGGFLLYRWIGNGSNQKFRLVKVERGVVDLIVTATGTINPVINVLVGSQVSGTIKALYADFNSQVKEGQVIAQIDPAIFQAQVDQAKANVLNNQASLLNAQANLVKAEVAVLDAKRNLDRNLPLVEKKVIAQATMDTAQANYDTAVAQKEVAKAQSGFFQGSGGAGEGCFEPDGDQPEICDHSVSGQWDGHFEECRCRSNRSSQPPGSYPFYHRQRPDQDAG